MSENKGEQELTLKLNNSVLKQIDRIAKEKDLTRDKIVNDILEDHFSNQDDWIDDLIR